MSKKEFLKLDIVNKQATWINIAGILFIALSAIQIPFLLTGASIYPITVVSSAILLGIGVALIVTKSVYAAWAMLIYSIINVIITIVVTGAVGGWIYPIIGISAVKEALEIERMWKEFNETGALPAAAQQGSGNKKKGKKKKKDPGVKNDRYGRVSDPVYTPAPSIDPAAIAAYQPNKNLTTVLASPDDPAPYGQNGTWNGQAAYPDYQSIQQPSGQAAYQKTTPAPSVAPAQYQETTPAPSVAPAQYQEQVAPSQEPEVPAELGAATQYEEEDTVIIPELHEETAMPAELSITEDAVDEAEPQEEEPIAEEHEVEEAVAEEHEIEETVAQEHEGEEPVSEEFEAEEPIVEEPPEETQQSAENTAEDIVMPPEVNEEVSDQEEAVSEKEFDKTVYGYKIVKEGLYGYHYFDGEEIVCTVEGVNASNTPVSIQGGGEHWYCINDWGIRVVPGQRKYIINYADDMTNGILEYKERDHYSMNYKAESVDAVIEGDTTTFTQDGSKVAVLKTERGTFARTGKDGYEYADEVRIELNISDDVGIIKNLIMAFPLLYFG